MPSSEPKAVLDQQGGNLALDLFVLSQHVGRLLDTALAGTGVTASRYAVYAQLAPGPRTPRELSETLGLRPTTLSGYLNALQRAGHITTTRHDRDDRSKARLPATDHRRGCRPRSPAMAHPDRWSRD